MDTDSNFLSKINDNDEIAFNHVFDTYYVPLCFFANKYLNDIDQARSLVQQVFVDLWTKRHKLSIHYSPKSYLYHAVKNRCIDFLRKEKPSEQLSESHENILTLPFQDLMEEAELNDRINSAINSLPEKCREIFLLCRYEDLKYAQIAERLNISIKTVEMQISIALKKLRKKISDSHMLNLLVFISSKK